MMVVARPTDVENSQLKEVIENEAEFRLLHEYVDETFQNASKKVMVEKINAMLSIYEGQNGKRRPAS